MQELNYRQLGFKCGIEIHQQLDGRKLFCNCPAELREDEPHYVVKRNLRAVAGEAGQIDIAAREEMAKQKDFYYQGHVDNGCLIELDEMPPNPINKEALNTTLQVCKMLNSRIVEGVQIMRKTVVDGSNTAGFQRTALIGTDGVLDLKETKLGIPTIILEEDACRNISEEKDKVIWGLDRLGIPLIEIGTTPGIRNPEEAKEAAEKLGMLIRSTGKAKRGIGTIRQDVNVSIKKGSRIEIKGAQDLKSIPKLIENEVIRQINLVQTSEELQKRRVKEQREPEIKDVTDLLKNSGSKIIKQALKEKSKVLGVRLIGFKGLIGMEIQEGRRLGTEFSDRAKVIAGVGGIFHSDELPNYGITSREVEILFKELQCDSQDGFVIVADKKKRAENAVYAVVERANQAILGVPMEVRKANKDNTSSYERPMPGAARMYPETDIPVIRISSKEIEKIEVPELIEEKIPKYEKMGLSTDLAKLVAKSSKACLFEKFVSLHPKIKAAFIAEVIMTFGRNIKRQFGISISPSEEDYDAIFSGLSSGKIAKENVMDILKENKPVKQIIGKYSMISDSELEEEIKKIVSSNKGLAFNALIGEVMKKLRGKASGKKISELLKKHHQ
ncbi:Glu-tRNA(Gln) amidotransferase subunit GatE [Candidatus Woesearchaeota archaeon]|nr:Glu-tRNA(Gln) amidotransferase subunit GatE [Candidatus Woesearchaeota archaeon]